MYSIKGVGEKIEWKKKKAYRYMCNKERTFTLYNRLGTPLIPFSILQLPSVDVRQRSVTLRSWYFINHFESHVATLFSSQGVSLQKEKQFIPTLSILYKFQKNRPSLHVLNDYFTLIEPKNFNARVNLCQFCRFPKIVVRDEKWKFFFLYNRNFCRDHLFFRFKSLWNFFFKFFKRKIIVVKNFGARRNFARSSKWIEGNAFGKNCPQQYVS